MRRDVRARRGQFAAVVVTIFLGLVLFALSYDAYANLKASYQRVFEITGFADFTVGGGDTGAILAAGEALPGVDTVLRRRVADLPIVVDGHKLLGRLVGLPVAGQPSVDGVIVLDGTYLSPEQSDGVLVEKHMAANFGLRPGDRLQVQGSAGPLEVVVLGEAASAEYLWPAPSRQQIFASQDDFGVLFVPESLLDGVQPSAVTSQVLFRYSPGADRASLDARLTEVARRHGSTDAFARADQPSNAALSEDIDGFGEMAVLFPMLFLGAAAMATYILLTRLVLSQQAQIGLLLSGGFRRRTVFRHFLAYGLVAAFAGAVPGLVVGIVLARFATRLYTDAVSVPIQVIGFHAETVIVGLLFAVAAGTLSTLAPAWRASRLAPATAMRGQVGSGRGGRSLLERLAPPLRALPTAWKMVIRGIGRNRRRSLSTVLGMILAATLILASWGMLDTTSVLLERQFVDIQRQDAEVSFRPAGTAPTSATPAEEVAAVAAVPGVQDAEGVAVLPATIRSASGAYSTELRSFTPGTRMHGFYLQGDGAAATGATGLLLGAPLRDLLGVAEADEVAVKLPSLGATLRERVTGFVDEPMGTFAYLPQPALQEALGPGAGDPVNAAMVIFAPGADAAVVREQIAALPQVAAVVDSRALATLARSFMGLFYAFVGLMVVLGGVMALALIYTTMSANISERLTELASLRAAGMGRRRLALLVTGENLLLTLLGIVPGLVVGYYASAAFLSSFSSDLFSLELELRPWTLPLVALALIAVALLSQWPVLRAVDRIDVAVVVRERSA